MRTSPIVTLASLSFWTLVAAHYATWLKYIPSSLWLDECGTVWLTKGGLPELFSRTKQLLHTPLFGAIATLIAETVGTSEVALRLPSWIAVGISIFVFHRLARTLFDPATAHAAVAVFVAWPLVSHAAADARPYPFAMVALCVLLLALVRVIRDGRPRDFVVLVIASAALVHLHLLFLYALAIPVLVLLLLGRPSLTRFPRNWLFAAGSLLFLLLPLLPYFLVLLSKGGAYSFTAQPQWAELTAALAPLRPMAFFCVGAVLSAGFIHRFRLRLAREELFAISFAFIVALVPVVLLFAVSSLTSARIFVPRYWLPAVPGIALLWGWIIGRVEPASARTAIAIFSLLIALGTQWVVGKWHHDFDDWKGAIQRANTLPDASLTPLVLYTAFVESAELDSATVVQRESFLLAPAAAYTPESSSLITLPLYPNSGAKTYWEIQFRDKIQNRNAFTVILRAQLGHSDWREYLERFARDSGFELRLTEPFGLDRMMMLLHFVKRQGDHPQAVPQTEQALDKTR